MFTLSFMWNSCSRSMCKLCFCLCKGILFFFFFFCDVMFYWSPVLTMLFEVQFMLVFVYECCLKFFFVSGIVDPSCILLQVIAVAVDIFENLCHHPGKNVQRIQGRMSFQKWKQQRCLTSWWKALAFGEKEGRKMYDTVVKFLAQMLLGKSPHSIDYVENTEK